MPDDAATPEDTPRTSLFVSYARADRVLAEKLCAALGRAGFEVWWDALIEGGAPFANTIADALAKVDAVVVLWSQRAVDSDWVRDEAAIGRERHRLVPVSLDGSEPPLGFRQYHTIELARWNGRANAPEIAAIARAVAAVKGAPVQPLAAVPERRVSRRTLLVGGAAAGAVAVAGGLYWAGTRGVFDGEAPNSIAVLPFRNLGNDPQQAFLAEGLTEEVRAGLRRIGSLKVVAAISSDAASESKEDAPTMARKLDVAWLLDGSVRREGDVVRVAVDLTEGATGFSKWSKSVDRPMSDIFGLESEITSLVAGAMSARVDAAAPPLGGTANVAAYEHFLRGRSLANLDADEATDRTALAEFEQAIALDPEFALAHAARSRIIAAIALQYAPAEQLQPLYDDATQAAQRAIDLAPDLAEAQLAMGFVLFNCRLQPAQARPYYDRAYALAQGNADIILLFAGYCARVGRADEAEAAGNRAMILDPLNARAHRAAGSIGYSGRRYRAALVPLARALELNPKLSIAHALTGYCHIQLGDYRAAQTEFEPEPNPSFKLTGLAVVRWRLNDREGARRYYERLRSEVGDSALFQQAQILAQFGDRAGALDALKRARAVGDSGLIYLATDPLLDPVRDAPEFTQLLKDMGFDLPKTGNP